MDGTVAEAVYGQALALPGELVMGTVNRNLKATTPFIQKLRELMASVPRAPVAFHSTKPSSVLPELPPSLLKSPYVFVRRGARGNPLQTPYEGPYSVLEAGPKFFLVDIKGSDSKISVDRLKPAFMNNPD